MNFSLVAALFTASVGALLPPPAPSAFTLPRDGRVVVECVVRDRGALSDCEVVEETPAGHGLGRRALQASATMRMAAPIVNGLPVTGLRVRIPFSFRL